MNDDELLRYSRHILLDGMDMEGQQALSDARVMIVGVGGLGSPVALYLAASGVGTLELVDPDVVELSNLQRQIAHSTDRIGMSKVDSAATVMHAMNPHCQIIPHPQAASREWLCSHLDSVDLVLDCTDNAAVRYQINLACLETKTPWISAAAIGLSGQLVFFDPSQSGSPCYRCLYPDLDRDGASAMADGCAESGVLSPVVGVVGSLQAVEALKYLSGLATPEAGLLQHLDLKNTHWNQFRLPRMPDCADCQNQCSD